jgi:hypothetical protein
VKSARAVNAVAPYTPSMTDTELADSASRRIDALVEHAPGTITVFTRDGMDSSSGAKADIHLPMP